MPTVNYTYSNTPPAGIPRTSQAHSNTPPGGVAFGSMSGTGGEPTAVPRASQTPNNAAPGAVTRADQTPSNSAPSAVEFTSMAGNNGAPAAIARASQTPSNAAPGAVPVANMAGTSNVPQAVAYAPIITDPTDATMHTAALHFIGNLVLNQVFGFYKAPATAVIKGVQLAVQKAPAGADVIVELVDADGITLNRTATLPAGQTFVNVTFGTPLPVLVDQIVRLKVTQIGTGSNPGAYLTANLVVQLT